MTRITILEQGIVQLQEKLDAPKNRRRELESQRIDELSRFAHQYFEDILEEGDTIKVSSNRVEFTRPQEGYNYNKELLTLYFGTIDYRDKVASEIQTSFYSTTDNSPFELRRMILIGKVGQIVLDFKDDILAEYNQIIEQHQEALRKVYTETYDIEKEIRDIKNKISKIEKENLFDKVEKEGIEFEFPEGKKSYNLPSLAVRFDRMIDRVKGIKIVNKTASGKSATIEVKTMDWMWDSKTETQIENEYTQTVEKVRMENIELFLDNNSKIIQMPHNQL